MNGKIKGNSFERTICKRLSLWVTDGKQSDTFWRSALSGGRSTIAAKQGRQVRQAGDITAVAPEGHALTETCFIECKFYRNLNLANFVLTDKGVLAGFWRKTAKEAYKRSKEPWLIAKQNHYPILLIAQLSDQTINRIAPKKPGWASAKPVCRTWVDNTPVQIWLLDTLLSLEWGKRP